MRDTTALPANYVLQIADMLAPMGIPAESLFQPAGVTREQLAAPNARVSLTVANDMLKRVIELTHQPAIGILAGLQMKISHHGYIGFAAMTAKDIGEALRIAERFAPLRSTAVDLQLMVEGDAASLTMVFDTDLEPLRQTALIAVCVGLVQMGAALTGKVLVGRGEFSFPRPDYLEPFLPALGENVVVFDQPTNRVVFPASYLDLPLTMSDPESSRMALEQCERELAALGEFASVVGRVRTLVQSPASGFLALEEVAERLHVSSRTLKRQLAAQGTTFSDLLDGVRREKALLLLANRALTIEQVADRLGYSDVANFTRAFRRWTGSTPSAWRGS
ncbi:MAG: AraC family transcriptional regulator [Pseudomonadota bacterium]